MEEISGKEVLQFENAYGEVRVIEKAKDEHSIIRVAAYCRVSTDLEMQQTSQYPYYGFLKCPLCGERMIRFQHPRNNHAMHFLFFIWESILRRMRSAVYAVYSKEWRRFIV